MADLPTLWQASGTAEPPDPLRHPELYEGITARRIFAYLIDAAILVVLIIAAWLVTGFAAILTLGLLLPLQPVVIGLIPLAYHILLVGGQGSATLGMRVMGIHVRSVPDDMGRPSMLQAAIQSVVFYGSMAVTGALILLAVFFNRYRRTLHDYLSGTIVLNRVAPPNQ